MTGVLGKGREKDSGGPFLKTPDNFPGPKTVHNILR